MASVQKFNFHTSGESLIKRLFFEFYQKNVSSDNYL